MSRMFGMAVDNLLELEFVTADGRIVVANDQMTHITYPNGSVTTSDDTDIFWASKGGGGGTFGIATKFTYKLHYPAPQVVQFVCGYPIIRPGGQDIGFTVLKKMFSMVQNLPKEWGGYLVASGLPGANGNWGSIVLAMTITGIMCLPHAGTWTICISSTKNGNRFAITLTERPSWITKSLPRTPSSTLATS